SISPMASSSSLWQEMLPGQNGRLVSELLEKQYDVVYGSWPTEYDEIVLVLDENNELDDMALYALGLTTRESMDALMEAAMNGTGLDADMQHWTYEEICDMEFRVVFGADCFSYDELTGTFSDLRETDTGLKYLYDNGTALKVSGIIRPNSDAVSTVMNGSIGYTSALTKYIIEKNGESAAVKAQLEDPDTDIFTGLPFRESTGNMTDEEKEAEFRAYVEGLETPAKAMTYVKIMSIPSAEELDAMVLQAKGDMDRAAMEETMVQVLVAQMGMAEDDIRSYTAAMEDEEIEEFFTQMVTEQVKLQYAARVQEQLAGTEAAQLAAALEMALPNYTTEQCAVYHDEVLVFSDSTYEDNLRTLSHVDVDVPSSINLYASSFENKDVIEAAIADYNAGVEDLEQIEYTDYVGLMMSSVTTIINAITYVLVAFVAVSLVVSSIMIGVITLISVQERTKEIGILRAIGASKRNVSSMFNAETMIIGLTSGLLGVTVTWLLCFPINAILHSVTGIQNLNAYLPGEVGVALVVISVLLTLIAGIIPSRSAAKKDPVVALRTE
ncbi:MAG: ABC transporter permease, partial [Clostridia bacterium]|nr:ABC transporter permease [Clostridia bacterium]